jgi:hypothetical protein
MTAFQSGQASNWGLDQNTVSNNLYDILGNMLYNDETEVKKLLDSNKKEDARKLVDSLLTSYKQINDPLFKSFLQTAEPRLRSLIEGKSADSVTDTTQ